MSSTPQHSQTHSRPPAQRASLPPSHNREYSSSHRPGSSMSISSMLGADTDVTRNRPSLPPPIPAGQGSPTTNGHSLVDSMRRDYNTASSRSYTGAHSGAPQQFGPPLAAPTGQSPPYRHAGSSSPVRSSYDYHRPSVLPRESQRQTVPENQYGRATSSWQGYEVSQDQRYPDEIQNNRVSDRKLSPTQSPSKQTYERDDPTYPFLPKPILAPQSNNPPNATIERPPLQRSFDSRNDRQSSSPELSRHHRENGLRSLQEIRRDSAGTPDPLSTPRSSPLLRRSFAVGAMATDDGVDRRVTDVLSDDRRGRASPLPQAVQGAQAQSKGPTNEPAIKNEFARMFSGIGSGVGSAVSTPVPQEAQLASAVPSSPPDMDGRGTPLGMRGSIDSRPRDSSRAAKRRKTKDDEIKREEHASVSLARTLSGRGSRTPRNNYQIVDLPQSPSHHHYQSHRTLDGAVLQKTTTFPQGNASGVVQQQYPQRQPHQGHRPPKTMQPISRKPQTTVNSQAVYDSVKSLPRRHLGSMLYQSTVSAPIGELGEIAKFGFICTHKVIPKFEDKDNCTFTIRVSRTFLERKAREEICERRCVWGADIYTDDSDPIAAAIHSGWLRGAWDEELETSVLNIGDLAAATAWASETAKTKEAFINVLEVPDRPMLPIPGRDLQITILLLPRLISYGSLVSHGIKSREWKTKHDGVSYKIDKVAWVDEGMGRGQERGGAAKRKRMRAHLDEMLLYIPQAKDSASRIRAPECLADSEAK